MESITINIRSINGSPFEIEAALAMLSELEIKGKELIINIDSIGGNVGN